MACQGVIARTWLSMVCFLLVFFVAAARGADYYVDGVTGSDSGTGTAEDPFLTVNRAVDVASGDDIIYIRPGVYHESIRLEDPALQGISLVGLPGEGGYPVIHSADPGSHTIEVKDFSGRIEHLEITGATDAIGINLVGDDNGVTTGRILDCRIHGNSTGVHLTTTGSTRSCDPLVRANSIYENRTRGIGFMNYATGTVEANDVFHNGSGLLDSTGIGVSGHAAPRIVNNTIHENYNAGISIRDFAAPVIINNTIVRHDIDGEIVDGTAIRILQNQGIDSLDIRNNIIAWNILGLVSQMRRPCSGNRHNLLWQNSRADYTGFVAGPGDLAADPGLVAPGAGDFHLSAGSVCIDAAESVASVQLDMDGESRSMGDGPDIGADEFRPTSVPSTVAASDDQQESATAMLLQPVYGLLLR